MDGGPISFPHIAGLFLYNWQIETQQKKPGPPRQGARLLNEKQGNYLPSFSLIAAITASEEVALTVINNPSFS